MHHKHLVGHLFSLCQKVGLAQGSLKDLTEVNALVEQARQLLLQAVDLLTSILKKKVSQQYTFDFDD